MIILDPIGTAETPFRSLSEAPSQGFLESHEGTISLDAQLELAIEGLSVGQMIDVVWYADSANRSLLRVNDDTRGVFASRSSDRPNPVSITRCEITAIEGTDIQVKGVDMIDGTPIVDLKPAYSGPEQEQAQSQSTGSKSVTHSADLD